MMINKKLVFVINTLQQGGAERVLSTLSNSFSARSYRVTIVCMNQADTGYPIDENIRVVTLLNRKGRQHLLKRVGYGLLTYIRLFKVILAESPCCVISFMTSANLWTGLTCGLLGVPYIVSERTTPELTIHQFNPFYKWLSFQVYKHSKAVVLPAIGIREALKNEAKFKQLKNYRIIRNPVYEFENADKKIVHNKQFILGIGRLSHEKGFDQLITAFAGLKVKNIDLLIIGVGKERLKLELQIERLGLTQRVQLLGPRNDVEHYYRAASVFVLPSRNEGYPNALVEAMSNGCACIAMNCEYGPGEIIRHGVNGILVPPGDIDQLSREIFHVLFDREYRTSLSEQAKLIKQTNSLAIISDKWEQLILI